MPPKVKKADEANLTKTGNSGPKTAESGPKTGKGNPKNTKGGPPKTAKSGPKTAKSGTKAAKTAETGEKKSKKKGGRKGKKGKTKIVDWSTDENFDKSRAIISIEFTEICPIFLTKAIEFHKFLEEKFPERMFVLAKNLNITPRVGAFEINLAQNARTDKQLIWSGIDKGPPRREKFPESYEELTPQIVLILNKPYIDAADVKPIDSLFALDEEEYDDVPPEDSSRQSAEAATAAT